MTARARGLDKWAVADRQEPDSEIPAAGPLEEGDRRYSIVYHDGEVNYCPGCGRTQWYVCRTVAECAFCATAIPIAAKPSAKAAQLTIRMTNEEKTSLEAKAADLGVTILEYISLAANNFSITSLGQHAELMQLTNELEGELPAIREQFATMRESLASAREAIAEYHREKAAAA